MIYKNQLHNYYIKSSIILQNQKKVTQGTASTSCTTERGSQVQSEVGVLNEGVSLILGNTSEVVTEVSCTSEYFYSFYIIFSKQTLCKMLHWSYIKAIID